MNLYHEQAPSPMEPFSCSTLLPSPNRPPLLRVTEVATVARATATAVHLEELDFLQQEYS